ncbi:unnamed protein product [Polarella glacialis]|uniref:Uncharacterized protein n=2 Tax=Polarella glacialis TaxID=89957 RepID=A0A813L9N1_POLGL|nr:unnamed protein product [Polarella glacialis]
MSAFVRRALLVTSVAVVCARPAHQRSPHVGDVPKPTRSDVVQVPIDHFDGQNSATFGMRYFVYDKHYRQGGPIFFYAGNEGPLESFYYNAGLPFDWAEEFGATILFAEHRYYGQSLPFGNDSFKKENLRLLQINQVLADYALFVTDFKAKQLKDTRAPVVVFGGSYGGMLAAWLRIKYANVFHMALAASAPIPQMYNLVPPTAFYQAITEDAAKSDARCPDATRQAFAAVIESFASVSGRATLSKSFSLCKPLQETDLSHFLQYARNAFTEMAMCDYPYPSTFLALLPANPIAVACQHIIANGTDGLAAAVGMPYSTGDGKCIDMFTAFVECADQTGCGTGDAAKAWDYQMCTEVIYEQFTNNVTDMFPPRKWTLADLRIYCASHYGTSPSLDFNRIALGGTDLRKVTSKIIFSNGDLDPWMPGGFLESQGPELPAVLVEGGAHHLDLRLANPLDPPGVLHARQQEKAFISRWLALLQGADDTQYV